MPVKPSAIEMFSGDNQTLQISVKDDAGGAVNIQNSKIVFTVKKYTQDPDEKAVIVKKNQEAGGTDSQIKITDAAAGQFEIYLVPADTKDLSADSYIYDIQITLANEETYTILRDRLTIKEDITHG